MILDNNTTINQVAADIIVPDHKDSITEDSITEAGIMTLVISNKEDTIAGEAEVVVAEEEDFMETVEVMEAITDILAVVVAVVDIVVVEDIAAAGQAILEGEDIAVGLE